MRIGIISFGQIAALVFVLSFELPDPAHAATLFNETFEGNLTPNWETGSCGALGCNPAISTDFAVNGTRSLEGVYNNVGGGTWIDRRFQATDDLYWRVWYRLSNNWVSDTTEQVKGFNIGDSNHYPNFWVMHHAFGSPTISIQSQGQAGPCPDGATHGACGYWTGTPMPLGTWVCYEGHIRMNTPGVSNGLVEQWRNGTLVQTFPNALLRPATDGGPGQRSSLATFSFIRVYVQGIAAVGSKYYDDLAVGNTRIGCGGTPPPPSDATPPTPPIGLTAR